jgi:hypothetical protein
VNNGVLSFSQSSGSPVRVQVYDMVGNRLLDETLYGTGTVDMKASIKARGTYFARVKVGNAQKNFRFTADGSFSATFGENARARALLKVGDNDDLRVIANGYDTLTVHLTNLDTNLTLVLKKPAPPQPQYAYGWGLKNDPVPSSGCGKDTKLDYKYRGDKPYIEFKWSKGTRTVRIDIPKSYDKNKPYKLIFGMQCMGGWAGGVQDEGYYGLKQFDKDETVIFVAPEGNGTRPRGLRMTTRFSMNFSRISKATSALTLAVCSRQALATVPCSVTDFHGTTRKCSALWPCTKLPNATSGCRNARNGHSAGWA